MMHAQRWIAPDPTGFALRIDEGHADRRVGLFVGQRGHFLPRLIAGRDPFLLQCDGIEVAGFDFVEINRIDARETHDHLEER